MTQSAPMDLDKPEDVFLQDISGPTIAEHALKCTELFQKNMALPNIVPDPTIMDDQLARFTLWASNMDVFGPPNISLDFRLRYSPNIVDILHQLLDVIYNSLMELKPIDEPPPTSSRKKQRISISDQVRMGASDDNASDTDSDEDQADKNTSLLTYTISGTVTRLFRLSNAIRKSSKASRAQKLKDYELDDDTQRAIDELRLYTDCYIRFRFPEAPESLRCALIEANVLRLRRLSYQRLHRRRIALSIEKPQPGQIKLPLPKISEKPRTVRFAPEVTPKTKARNEERGRQDYPPAPLTYATTAQQTEIGALYAKSTTEVPRAKSVLVNNELSFPPIPQQNECPYCGVIIEFKGPSKSNIWRTHVIRDLEPFICLFTTCTDSCRQGHGPLTFESSKAWMSHMQNSHGIAWECRAPSHKPMIFRDEIQFQKHSYDEHGVPEAHVRTLSEAARRPFQDKIQECPFGDDFVPSEEADRYGIFSYENLHSHVAAHMKELALLALQKLPHDGETEASDFDSDILIGDDGNAKLRGSMCSIMDDDELNFSDTVGDNQAGDPKESITSSIKNLDLEDIEQPTDLDALRQAIQGDDVERVRALMHLVTRSDRSRGKKPLHYAAFYRKKAIMKLLLESSDHQAICAKDENGLTPLHYAARGGFVEGIGLLVQAGATIDMRDDYEFTPLLWAAVSGHLDAIEKLESLGVDPADKYNDLRGTSAVGWAIGLGLHDLAMHFIKSRPPLPKVSEALLMNQAAAQGMLEVVSLLISEGVSLNERDKDGWSALHWAAEGPVSHTKGRDIDRAYDSACYIMQRILDSGADPNAVSLYGTSPLHCAAGVRPRRTQLLLENGVDLFSATCHGWTPMHHAAYTGHHSIMSEIYTQCFRSEGGDRLILSQDNHGWSTLHLAVLGRHLDTVRELLYKPLRDQLLVERDELGRTAEDWLEIELGSHTYAKLSNLAYSKSRCCRPVTGLRKAARENIIDLVELLLDQGHGIDGTDPGQRTALYYAASKGHLRIVELLLSKGADPNILPVGRLMWELFVHDSEILRQLRRYGYSKPVQDLEKDNQIRLMLHNAASTNLLSQPKDSPQPTKPNPPAQNTSASSDTPNQATAESRIEQPRSRMSSFWKRLRG
ncbi:ankyrin repeat domain-containing protein [Fusarium mexicanum]|uniref:Ankyrin repeat domain-containing protein n=1 Tax=Fusarium mexicanum TaxID=751941 RepID=A0A8H5MJ73_9HYPO|nr:ankyrin repeat domain-containing protein [Fusarium mexicanum]